MGLLAPIAACTPQGPARSGEARAVEVAIDVPRLAADAGPAVVLTDGVRFGHPPAVPGTKQTIRVHGESFLPDNGRPNGPGEQRNAYDSELRTEILAVEGPAASRIRVKVDTNVRSAQGAAAPTSIHGKTYVVVAKEPYVLDASDRPAPADEAEKILDIFPDIGMRARVEQAMPDAPLHVGETRDELAEVVLHILHPRVWHLVSGHATLARVADGTAFFDATIEARSDQGIDMKIDGEIAIRVADSRLVSLRFSGKFVVGVGVEGTFSTTRRVIDGW